MASLYPKVLFFIGGTTPTPEQIEEADAYGPGVAFRNAALVHPDGPIEEADAVAGPNIPDNYAEALPHIDDRAAVKERVMARNPNLANMGGEKPKPRESDAEREARIANALARGQRPAPINERNADATIASERTTQSGHARVTHAEPSKTSADGWGTNPETLNDAAADGQGVGGTDGGQGGGTDAPLGAQGAGGPGTRAQPETAPQGGGGNPRARPGGKPKP